MNPDHSKSADVNAKLPVEDPTGQDPAATDPDAEAKLQLQLAIFEVSKDSKGRSLDEIITRLRAAFADHGVDEPPFTWLESVASSAYYGEPYIIDFPTALAADDVVAAPNEQVRERLEKRRELREEKLPPGILPSASDWNIPEAAGRSATAGANAFTPPASKNTVLLAVAGAVVAAAVVALSLRASRRRGKGPQAGATKARSR
ncbi:hypothetical protein ABC337_13010 [Arthrobacter sp. 1P04PC]|uniref:hypothetical protein n=1 Tax=unclassified Arthrobacter TaxID=235627 RepID=UPI0039A23DC2